MHSPDAYCIKWLDAWKHVCSLWHQRHSSSARQLEQLLRLEGRIKQYKSGGCATRISVNQLADEAGCLQEDLTTAMEESTMECRKPVRRIREEFSTWLIDWLIGFAIINKIRERQLIMHLPPARCRAWQRWADVRNVQAFSWTTFTA